MRKSFVLRITGATKNKAVSAIKKATKVMNKINDNYMFAFTVTLCEFAGNIDTVISFFS
ncbi:hypothetical protein JCM19237_283 [Photobacterium aphoticum]|uniref:Uncharacterized protein n=1 Tax=Photobacterium aphoticum TaxID=754436 RepID=A0A090R051_9GAMM|nr:hypothetical protein JCM19237_283 [Photobacterium aphoticum]